MKTLHDDTILWSEESDNYTRRAFEDHSDTYNDPTKEKIIISLNELFKKNDFMPKSILDIGCSCGFSFPYYQKYFKGAKLYGIDPGNKESIQTAKEKFKVGGIEFSNGYAHDLPYPDESMDVVFLSMVLQWIQRKKLLQSLAEIDRVSIEYIILMDFLPDYPSWSVSRHNEMVKIFKQDYSAIFVSLPWWRILKNEVFNINEGTDFQRSVTILRKLPYSKGYTQRGSVFEDQIHH